MGLSSSKIKESVNIPVQHIVAAELLQPFKAGVEELRHEGALSDFTITSYQSSLVPQEHPLMLETQGLKAEQLQTKASSHGVLTPSKSQCLSHLKARTRTGLSHLQQIILTISVLKKSFYLWKTVKQS